MLFSVLAIIYVANLLFHSYFYLELSHYILSVFLLIFNYCLILLFLSKFSFRTWFSPFLLIFNGILFIFMIPFDYLSQSSVYLYSVFIIFFLPIECKLSLKESSWALLTDTDLLRDITAWGDILDAKISNFWFDRLILFLSFMIKIIILFILQYMTIWTWLTNSCQNIKKRMIFKISTCHIMKKHSKETTQLWCVGPSAST